MSERRFTRLKATLSEHGTAAKTRETVSRELRQSLNVNNDESTFMSCIEADYECKIRQWQQEQLEFIEQQQQPEHEEKEWVKNFYINDEDDIKCIDEPKMVRFDFNRYYCSDKIKITSPFSNECLKHYTDCKHYIRFSMMQKYFGSSYNLSPPIQTPKQSPPSSSSSQQTKSELMNDMFQSSKSFALTNHYALRPHTFECDDDENDLCGGVYGQKMLIREGNASVMTVRNEKNRMMGWLTLSRDETDCFLTFYDCNRRQKILWHIEVNQKVLLLNNSSFQVNGHIISTDSRFIDDWIKDINSNIVQEFDPNEQLERILSNDDDDDQCDLIADKIQKSMTNNTKLFAAYNDINNNNNQRQTTIDSFINNNNGGRQQQQRRKIFRFVLQIKSTSDSTTTTTNHTSTVFHQQHNNIINRVSNSIDYSYLYRICLFDCKWGKISEEFRYVQSADIDHCRSSSSSSPVLLDGFDQKLMSTISQALFEVDLNHSNVNDLYLVLRVERTLHRLHNYHCYPVNNCDIGGKSSTNYNHMPIILHHVEPYAWSIRPLFHTDSMNLLVDTNNANFGPFYRMDQNRLSDEFIVNMLNQVSMNQSNRSQTTINGRLEIDLCDLKTFIKTKQQQENHNDNDAAEIVVIDSFGDVRRTINNNNHHCNNRRQPLLNPILEIESLRIASQPFNEFRNILYIYPQSLRYESQRVFSKARNLCVTIEIRDSDVITTDNDNKSLPVIFGRPHDKTLFVTSATTAVFKHNVTPDFFEEIKVALPLNFSDRLHILFTFTHISCKKECSYSIVGYSWLPISSEKYPIHCSNVTLSVFASLPNNYLSCQSLGLGKGLSMPEVKLIGKDVYKVSLLLMSTIISRSYELHSTLLSIMRITQSNRDDSKELSQIISLERQLPKMLQQLSELPDDDDDELIHFSQIIMQQLLKLIVYAASQELIQESLSTLIRLVDRFQSSKNYHQILMEFVDCTFETVEFCGVYIHDQLIQLIVKMFEQYNNNNNNNNSGGEIDEMLKLLMSTLSFLLQIIIKSMVQYLIRTERIKCKQREQRFDNAEFVLNMKKFFEMATTLITVNSRLEQAQLANGAISHFMTRLLSFFDRSIVYNAINHHVLSLSTSRDLIIQELKLTSLQIFMSHEYFILYCNPFIYDDESDCATATLSIDYCLKHFPMYLILNEFRHLYQRSSAATSVRQIRQLALSIIRNQLIKTMLDDRFNSINDSIRQMIINLYMPMLTVILENCDRIMDVIISNNNTGRFEQTIFHHNVDNTAGLRYSTAEISSSTLSSISSYNSTNSNSSNSTIGGSTNTLTGHNRSNSSCVITTNITNTNSNSSSNNVRFDKFSMDEVRDLLICFLCIVQTINCKRIKMLKKKQQQDLLLCLELSMNCFEYKPKKLTDNRSKTMPNLMMPTKFNEHLNHHHSFINTKTNHHQNQLNVHLLQQNLSIQSSLITLKVVQIFITNNESSMEQFIVSPILSIYLTMMTLPQSEQVLIYLFDSVRHFIRHHSHHLFDSYAFLSPIVSKIVRYCNSSLTSIRQAATDLLYCLFVTNMKRTRFETIVSVSRLASTTTTSSDDHQTSSSHGGLLYLHSSLNRLEQLAIADTKTILNQNESDCDNDNDNMEEEEVCCSTITTIVERIREIIKATKQIREDHFDPYSASELRLQLANSYARTSRSLLRTWLENLSDVHVKNNDWCEAAICLCQVIAILIEQLASKDVDIIDGMLNIVKVSDNIVTTVNNSTTTIKLSDWLELEQSHVSIEILETIIDQCVDLLEKAELYELAPYVLKVLMSTYEKEYEHRKLSQLYTRMARMHSKALEINDSGKRIFDTFFRVAFYHLNTGQKMEYIYKMTKLVSLAEMTAKMQSFYPDATFLAADSPAIQQIEMTDKQQQQQYSNLIIVITHVTPYTVENANATKNQFEKNVGVQQFVYEQRLDSKIAQSVAEQYKKRVILTAGHSFPYFLKRIPVISKQEVILNPIDVAIDEMQQRVHQLEHVIMNENVKHLQLVLQGSVHVTVNCGPIAYANAFLKHDDDQDQGDQDDANFDESQKHLKFLFEQFLDLCESALKLNERLIKSNQIEYHNNLKLNFEKLKSELHFLKHRCTYIPIFDAISGPAFDPFS